MNIVTHNYTPDVDITICLLSMLLFFLLTFSYNKKNFHLKILQTSNIATFFAGISSIVFNTNVLKDISEDKINIIYLSHHCRKICLIFVWIMIILYLYSVVYSNKFNKRKNKAVFISVFSIVLYSAIEIISSITKLGFYIEDNVCYEKYMINPFSIAYMICAAIYIILFIININVFPKKTFFYLALLSIYCFAIMFFSTIFKITSFYIFSFYIPVLFIYIIFHGYKLDISSGTLGIESFFSFISELLNKKKNFTIISINILKKNNIKKDNVLFNNLSKECSNIFRNNTLFKKNDNILNIIIKEQYNENIEKEIQELEKLIKEYRYDNDIRITVLKHFCDIFVNDTQQVIDFNKFLLEKTDCNNTYIQTKQDYDDFLKEYYIKEELIDIKMKRNLDDERVLVYCQPILNSNKKYENAEILMRLNLPKTDFILPNDFIPIAEKYDLIHTLTLIILNKTCKEIKKLLNSGYKIDRFSINFSANEFNNPLLFEEVIKIIEDNNIPFEKLAFEITETSFNETNNLNNTMEQLIKKGIKFYLDDFGTGYSNIDRISELPFSTIKFDRSLILSALKKDTTKYIVKNLCNIFNDLHFDILFEGIETDKDEIFCKDMGAKYFQGYKYSKPIPVEKIKEYLSN